MTNEEKATELGIKYQTPCKGIGDCEFEARQAAMEMAEWKEQQMIDKACKLYRDELLQFNGMLSKLNSDYDGLVDVEKSLKDFKKAMKGGEEC